MTLQPFDYADSSIGKIQRIECTPANDCDNRRFEATRFLSYNLA